MEHYFCPRNVYRYNCMITVTYNDTNYLQLYTCYYARCYYLQARPLGPDTSLCAKICKLSWCFIFITLLIIDRQSAISVIFRFNIYKERSFSERWWTGPTSDPIVFGNIFQIYSLTSLVADARAISAKSCFEITESTLKGCFPSKTKIQM